jgi:hypothetical protein
MNKTQLFQMINELGDSAYKQISRTQAKEMNSYFAGKREAYLLLANIIFDKTEAELDFVKTMIASTEAGIAWSIENGDAKEQGEVPFFTGKLDAVREVKHLLDIYLATTDSVPPVTE